MSERKDTESRGEPKGFFYFERVDVALIVGIVFGFGTIIVSVGYIVLHAGFSLSNIKTYVDMVYTFALVLGGFLTLIFAGIRLNQGAKQTFHIQKESERKDRVHIADSLQGAVKLLQEPADSMKYLAISQMKQLGTDYPNQTMEQVVRSLCAQAREYRPHFSENDLECIRQSIMHRIIEPGLSEHIKRLTSVLTYQNKMDASGFSQSTIDDLTLELKELETTARYEKVVGRLIEVVVDLAVDAKAAGASSWHSIKSIIDLRGVRFSNANIRALDIEYSKFDGCHFFNVNFSDCTFSGDFFNGSEFKHCTFSNCTFVDAIFYSVKFPKAVFSECDFINVKWLGVDFCEAKFIGIRIGVHDTEVFSKCRMTAAEFSFMENFRDTKEMQRTNTEIRRNFFPHDFVECYVVETRQSDGEGQIVFPQGLEGNSPSLHAESGGTQEHSSDECRVYFEVQMRSYWIHRL
ncbi:MAG: pentapeptide repeat-containing protein [Parvibaculaceae bacterium]|nr:pentapeptide repeat-containing protein [Parvibaculaceae bacterium]